MTLETNPLTSQSPNVSLGPLIMSCNPGVLEDKAQVEASLVSAYHRASFLAAFCQQIGRLHYTHRLVRIEIR